MNAPSRLALLATLALPGLLALPVRAQVTFVVNTTDDAPDAAIDGVCDADAATVGEQCTLRAAIQESEATTAHDAIHFDIPGPGPHTIAIVGSNLPTLFDPLTIDGYSQPGASANTNGPEEGTNAVILVELVNGDGGRSHGLRLCFGTKTIRGLAVGGFTNGGISMECTATPGHVVEGCFVGTDAGGAVARPNGQYGVGVFGAANNRIGGTSPAARNLISGNGIGSSQGGVILFGQSPAGNVVQGNLIGTDASGTAALPNTPTGLQLQHVGSAAGVVIGGPTPAERNVISGNAGRGFGTFQGVGISADFSGVRFEGNFVGTDVTGALPLPNTGVGVRIEGLTSRLTIGGTAADTGNRIAHNGGAGVALTGAGTRNAILGNTISDNAGLGIDLHNNGATPNDPGDPDTGSNRLQNFPEITAVELTGSGDLVVTYRVDTDAAHATYPFRVEVFRSDGAGEGAAFLGADLYTLSDHDGCGTPPCEKTAAFTPAALLASGDRVVATATDSDGNTSEFTAVQAVVLPPPPATDPPLWLSFAPDPTAYPDTLAVTVLAGDPTAPVTDLFGLGFRLAYDPERFAFLGAAPGPFLDDGDLLAFAEAGPDFVAYSLSRRRGAPGASGHGAVAVLRFLTLLADSVAVAPFTPSDVLAVNSTGALLALVPVAGAVTVEPQFLVWPGDTDDSGLVEAADLLPIGLYFGVTGPVRGPLDFSWAGQPAAPWAPAAATFADAASDGVISQNDLLPVGLNYGLTQALRHTEPETPPVAASPVPPMPAGTRYRLDLHLGHDAERPLLGTAAVFALPPVFALDALAPGALLDDGALLAFHDYAPGTGRLDAAYSRKRGAPPATGAGPAIALTFAVADVMASPAEVALVSAKASMPEGSAGGVIRSLGPGEALLRTPVAVAAEPVGGPVVIGPEGGAFRVRVSLTNPTAQAQGIQAWAGVAGPASVYPLGTPVALTLGPGATASRTLTQRVPASAPPGEYTYSAFGGGSTALVLGGASFPVTKEGTLRRGGDAAEGWLVVEWEEADWAVSAPGEGVSAAAGAGASTEEPPGAFALEAPYPNPFTAATTLPYALPEPARVRLAVYDVLGREVAVLVDGPREAGRHEVTLDGRLLPAGLYLVRMTTEANFTGTRSATLVR